MISSANNALKDSFRFHREMETLRAFCRRERLPLIFFGLAFTLSLIAIILVIDESFFYSRIQTDALWYYLKGKTFAETARTSAKLAVNLPPYVFPSMPGVFRSPFIRFLSSFDDQLRAIQLTNLVIMDAIAVMSAYILSWVTPRRWHWLVIGFSFAFSLVAPVWIENTFLPLTDAPYAALSVASMLIAIAIMRTDRPSARARAAIAFAIAAAAAFLFRYTEPAVLILLAALALGRPRKWQLSARTIGVLIATIAAIAILVVINRQTIFVKYVHELGKFVQHAEIQSLLLNFFCLAIPQQIIPGFDLGFPHFPILGLYSGEFADTRAQAAWSFLGLLISAIVVAGAWRTRRRLAPEILMVLAVLPALVLLMPSTPRYLMTYQAFFWIWFYEGSRFAVELIPARARVVSKATALVGVGAALAIGLALSLRHRGLLNRENAVTSPAHVAAYMHGQTATYRPLATFMESLPRDRAILVSLGRNLGRWKAISNLDYYYPDSAVAKMAGARDMYLVIECGSPPICKAFSRDEAAIERQMGWYGKFTYAPVFEATAEKSHAMVFRVSVSADSGSDVAGTQKGNP